ncbi:MAG TPA: hypothetical protein VK077_09020 [Virgibacillus sp.]|nr:hypothetical protein [Virgibacillus sp.]
MEDIIDRSNAVVDRSEDILDRSHAVVDRLAGIPDRSGFTVDRSADIPDSYIACGYCKRFQATATVQSRSKPHLRSMLTTFGMHLL